MKRSKVFISILFLCSVINLFGSSPKNGVDLLMKWETEPVRTLYLYKDVAASEIIFQPIIDMKDLRVNEKWYVENNFYGMMAYMAGVRTNDKKLKDYGVNILDFAMKQQNEDGEFPEKNDIHHSLAFYYEIVARFLILSEKKGFADDVSPVVMNRLRTGLRSGVIWFAKESSWNDKYWRDELHHRYLLNASAILLSQRALGNLPPETLNQAYKWINIAIERQLPDGVMTEKGGHDSNYQSLGITFAIGMLMVCDLPEKEKKQLENLAKNATNWLLTRISDSGEIDDSGNTRMGGNSKEINRTDGKQKRIKPYEHAFAIFGSSYYFNDSRYKKAAENIMKFYKY